MADTNKNIIDENSRIRCPWCGKVSTVREWDDASYSYCSNRQLKRLYIHLTDPRAFMKKTEVFFDCPKCNQWTRGSNLRILKYNFKDI